MRHDWVFDVLEDLRAYAALNGLVAMKAAVDEALQVARAEVAMGREGTVRPRADGDPAADRLN